MKRKTAVNAVAMVALWALVGVTGCASSDPVPPNTPTVQQSGEDLYDKGHRAVLRGDHARAEQYLKMALADGYEPPKTVLLLVQVCLSGSRLRGALNYAEPFLLEHPEEDALRFLVATLHQSLGHGDAALHQLERLIQRSPSYADAYYLRGQLRLGTDSPRAKLDFLHYLELSPEGRHAVEVESLLADIELLQASLVQPLPVHQVASVSVESPSFVETEIAGVK